MKNVMSVIALVIPLLTSAYLEENVNLSIYDPETNALIRDIDGKEAGKILSGFGAADWFFIPQVMTLKPNNEVWLAIRVFSRHADLEFSVEHVSVSTNSISIAETEYGGEQTEDWLHGPQDWLYTVRVLEVFSYSDLSAFERDSVKVEFSVVAEGLEDSETRTESFDLVIEEVAYANWL